MFTWQYTTWKYNYFTLFRCFKIVFDFFVFLVKISRLYIASYKLNFQNWQHWKCLIPRGPFKCFCYSTFYLLHTNYCYFNHFCELSHMGPVLYWDSHLFGVLHMASNFSKELLPKPTKLRTIMNFHIITNIQHYISRTHLIMCMANFTKNGHNSLNWKVR